LVAVIATVVAVSRFSLETTAAVGCSFAISSARLGPDATATRSPSSFSSWRITSLIREPVPFSTPFMSETISASSGMSSRTMRRFSRRDCDGTDR